MNDVCLSVKDLSLKIERGGNAFYPVHKVSFEITRGSVLGIVGESGAGKSLVAKAIMGLLKPKMIECSGQVTFENMKLSDLSEEVYRKLRGPQMGMIFQDPMAALNPVMTIGRQIRELYTTHLGCSGDQARSLGLEMLKKAQLPEPEKIWHEYPHQLSGGMRQRVMIAMAMALGPSLLIADEPTTSLDVTTQAEILNELKLMKKQTGAAILLISHDMGVIAEMADSVAVMRAGEIVEYNDCYSIFDNPQHGYTKKLLRASRMII